MMDGNFQTVAEPTNRSSGIRAKNLYSVSINEKGEYERDEQDIQKVKVHSDQHAGPSNVIPSDFSHTEHEEELHVRSKQYDKEDRMHSNNTKDASMGGNNYGQQEKPSTYFVSRDPDETEFCLDLVPVYTTTCKYVRKSDDGMYINQKPVLLPHQRINTKEEDFACSVCGDCFRLKSNLINHQKIHTGRKLYTGYNLVPVNNTPCKNVINCDNGMYISNETDLCKSQDIYPEKKFTCSKCGKCFTKKYNFVRHQTLHTDKRSFSCRYCGKYFAQQFQLVNHKKIHTREQPVICSD